MWWRVAVLLPLLALWTAEAAHAAVQQRSFSLLMEGQPLGGTGPRPYLGRFGPVSRGHLTGIEVPGAATEDLRVLFVKPGFGTSDCTNPAAVVVVRDGESMSASQFREAFGTSRLPLTSRIAIVACASVTPFRPVDRFRITLRYEQQVDDAPPPPPPPVKDEVVEDRGNTRIHRVTCQQLGSNAGCRTSFACPSGFALTRAGAVCDLENGRLGNFDVRFGSVLVGTVSDKRSDGLCRFGNISISAGRPNTDDTTLSRFTTRSSSNLSCSENDANGGDCAIEAMFECRRIDPQALTTAPFSCARSNSNEGCSQTVACPANTFTIGARASCNLETASPLALPAFDRLSVVRASDEPAGSRCMLGTNRIMAPKAPTSIPVTIQPARLVGVVCAEHDQNGGDCVITGELRCAGLATD